MRDYASLNLCLLSDLGFESTPDGHVLSDMTLSEVAKTQLAVSFFKKLQPSGNTKKADDAALKKFKDINAALKECPTSFCASNEIESLFWDYLRDNFRVALESQFESPFTLDFIRETMMVGPGSAQKADSSCMITKLFEGEMSYTNSDLIRLYRGALVETGYWADAEMHRFGNHGFTAVNGGKIFFAPKNAEISRTCCTEANLNMLIQKSIGEFFERCLVSSFGINLSTEPDHNRELARKGSIDQSYGTIDLVSASDSISYQLVQDLVPNSFLKAVIRMSRSEKAILPDGSEVDLRMVSTMGNGFTFPLQTLIFASVVRSAYQLMDFIQADSKNRYYGVFGDDIVVRREAYTFVCQMLNKLGFKVNAEKSFNSGPFRESCGHDYASGCNVRGVYVRSLETPQEVYSLVNRLLRWVARHGIMLPTTLKLLTSWVRDIRVPCSESDDAGIHVPFCMTQPRLTSSYWFQYRSYVRRGKKMVIDDNEETAASPLNKWGVAVGFLSGSIRRRDILLENPDDSAWKHDWSASVTLRDRMGAKARYQIVTKTIPYWDYVRPISKRSEHNQWESTGRIDLTIDSYGVWKDTVMAHI